MPAGRGHIGESFLEQLEAHLAAGDVATATFWLQSRLGQETGAPWPEIFQLAQARLQEAGGHTAAAEAVYRDLLKTAAIQKVRDRARAALQGILDREQQARQTAIAAAMTAMDAAQVGFLIVKPVAADRREDLARRLARFFQTDAVTAKTWLPVRHPKILRLGPSANSGYTAIGCGRRGWEPYAQPQRRSPRCR
ncbi:MAG: hypothetical protein HC918_02140 [Oscillatoriales cyanobacterium SM2_1_8]|nr:hypothetical protein [Oscillatoriales cyanobacterium SM2_1_8]